MQLHTNRRVIVQSGPSFQPPDSFTPPYGYDAFQEATVRTGHGTTDWFQIGKGIRQGCILSPCLFNFYAEYFMRNTGLEEAQAGIKAAGRCCSDVQMKTTLNGRK